MNIAGRFAILVAVALFLIAGYNRIKESVELADTAQALNRSANCIETGAQCGAPEGLSPAARDGLLVLLGCAFLVPGLAMTLGKRRAADSDSLSESVSISPRQAL